MASRSAERQARSWEKTRYLIDRVFPLLTNPTTLLVGGFVAAQYLQNTAMKYTPGPNSGHDDQYNPGWPVATTLANVGDIPINYLTPDQANILRAGLVTVMAANSGIFDKIKGLFE
jgi:hypothetical protein